MKPPTDAAIQNLLTKREGMLIQDLPIALRSIACWIEAQQESLNAILEPPTLETGHYLVDFPAHPDLKIEVFEAGTKTRFHGIWCRGVDISELISQGVYADAEARIEHLNADAGDNDHAFERKTDR